MRPVVIRHALSLSLFGALGLVLAGCSATGSSDPAGLGTGVTEQSPMPQGDIDALLLSAREQARRSEQAIAARAQQAANAPRPDARGSSPNTSQGPEVRWLNSGGVSGDGSDEQRALTPVARQESSPAQAKPAVPQVRQQTRQQLMDELMAYIAQRKDPAMRRALTSAMMGIIDPQQPIAWSLLEPLTPPQRQTVEHFRQVAVQLGKKFDHAPAQPPQQAVQTVEPVQDVPRVEPAQTAPEPEREEQPIKITHAELCTRVAGFGNFDPFASRTFLRGRAQRMIVYVELDHFKSVKPQGSDKHKVKLTQEVVLFNDADGLAVWRQEPVEIVDESSNQRRDFFVVQLIELPARLGVGKYSLKIRVTDKQAGSLDETTLPLQFVADQKMVGK